MKSPIFAAAALSILLTGCGKAPAPTPVAQAEIVPPAPVIDHYYALKDGYDYGYERVVSAEDANQGKVASDLLMFRYAGKQGDKYQAYMKVDNVVTVSECVNPCEFIKIITLLDGSPVKVDRMRAVPNSIGWLVMADAINGKLEPFTKMYNGKKISLWFDEKKGIQTNPVTAE